MVMTFLCFRISVHTRLPLWLFICPFTRPSISAAKMADPKGMHSSQGDGPQGKHVATNMLAACGVCTHTKKWAVISLTFFFF